MRDPRKSAATVALAWGVSAAVWLPLLFPCRTAQAAANLIDADFEEGNLDGWNTYGTDANDTVSNVDATGLDMEGNRCIHIHNEDDTAGNIQLLKPIPEDYNGLVALEFLVRKMQTDRVLLIQLRRNPLDFYIRLQMADDGTIQNNGVQIGSLTYSANTTYRYRLEIDLNQPTTWDFHIDGVLVGDDLPVVNANVDRLEYIQFVCFAATTDVYIDDVELYGDPFPQTGGNQMKWVGDTDTNWTIAANWAPQPVTGASPPTSSDQVRIEAVASASNAPVVIGAAVAKDVSIEGGSLTLQAGSTLILANGATLTADGASTFTASGTGWGANQVTVTSVSGTDHYSINLAGDVDVDYTQFESLTSSGLLLSGSDGATVSMSNVSFRSNQGGAGSKHMLVSGTDWSGCTFDGFSFEGTGSDNPTYAVEISSGGTVTMSDYDGAVGRIYGDAYDSEVTGTVIWGVMATPGITSVAADDPDDGDETLSDGDTFTITFDTDTNQPPAAMKAEIDGLIGFGVKSLGADYAGTWSDAATLVVTVLDATGGDLGIGDTVTIIADGTDDLKNAPGTSPASTDSEIVTGDWGDLTPPVIVSFVADDPDDLDDISGTGDTIAVTFNKDTNQSVLVSGTKTGTEMDGLFTLSGGHTFGDASASYTLTWADALALTMTVDSVSTATVDVGDTIAIQAAADIRNAAGTSPATADTSEPMTGDWGIPLPPPGAFNLLSPADGSVGVSATPGLDWDASSDVSTYALLVDNDPGFGTPEVDENTHVPSGYVVAGGVLSAGVTYYWRVTAVNASGTTPASNNDFSFTTEQGPMVTGLTADDPDDGDAAYGVGDTITVTFDVDTNQSMNGQTKTGVEMDGLFTLSGGHTFGDSGDSYFLSWSDLRTLVVTVESVSSSDVQIGDTLTVVDIANIRDSALTLPASTDTSPPMTGDWGTLPPPGAFSLSTPTNGSIDVSLTPTLDWGDSADATTYTLLVDDDAAFLSAEVDEAALGVSTYTVGGSVLSAGVQYYWRVTAVNASGSTPASNNDFDFTTLRGPSVTSLTADDPDDNDNLYGVGDTITAAFNIDTNRPMNGQTKTGAELDGLFTLSGGHTFGDSGDGYFLSWLDLRMLVVTVEAVSSSDVQIGDTITVLSAADIRDSTGASDPCTDTSPAMTGDWGTLPPPGAFSLLTPASGSTSVSLTPTLDWEDSSDAATCTLLVDDDVGFGSPEADETALGVSTYTVGASVLSAGVTYYWRVTAVNGSGSTAASNNDFSFTTVTLLSAVLTVPATGEAGSPVTIGVEVSSGTEPYAITLDFGDGSPVYVETGSTGSVTMDHVYATGGEFGVSVTARDSADAVATDAATIQVSPDETPPVVTVISPESGATIYGTKVALVGTVSEPVTSVAVQGEEIGETPATIHADGVHWYATVPSLCEGSYALTVAATDLAGNTTTVDFDLEVVVPKKLTVTIAEPATTTESSATQVALDEPVTFEATAKGGLEPYGYSWDFGDGSTVDASPPITHTYASTGYFLVTLTVTDSGAEVGSDAVVLEAVPPALVPQVSFSPASPKVGERVTFDAGATEGEVRWYYWDWDGDGALDEFSSSPTVVHTFTETGAYDVTLRVEDAYGQTASAWAYVPVSAGGERASVVVSPLSVSFRGRPGVAEVLKRYVTVTNDGPAGSVAAVAVNASQMPSYVTVAPLSFPLLPQESETIALQLDLSLLKPGQDIHTVKPLVLTVAGAADVPTEKEVAVTIELSPARGWLGGGCATGHGTDGARTLALACIVATLGAVWCRRRGRRGIPRHCARTSGRGS